MSLIEKYFPELSEKQKERFARLPALYKELNEQVNVVSRKDIDNLEERHILHSLGIAKFHDLSKSKVLDLGTGGGFPGIPLAILFEDAQFTLVDSIAKKIKVVQTVSDELGLDNVKSIAARGEKVRGTYSFCVTRAVTKAATLWHWVHQKLDQKSESGLIALKGGDLTEELRAMRQSYALEDLSTVYEEPFFETKNVLYVPS